MFVITGNINGREVYIGNDREEEKIKPRITFFLNDIFLFQTKQEAQRYIKKHQQYLLSIKFDNNILNINEVPLIRIQKCDIKKYNEYYNI